MMESLSTSVAGRTPRTMTMEMIVPRPRQVPRMEITGLVEMLPISRAAADRMVPEVKMVGKEAFSASTMASLWVIVAFSS